MGFSKKTATLQRNDPQYTREEVRDFEKELAQYSGQTCTLKFSPLAVVGSKLVYSFDIFLQAKGCIGFYSEESPYAGSLFITDTDKYHRYVSLYRELDTLQRKREFAKNKGIEEYTRRGIIETMQVNTEPDHNLKCEQCGNEMDHALIRAGRWLCRDCVKKLNL